MSLLNCSIKFFWYVTDCHSCVYCSAAHPPSSKSFWAGKSLKSLQVSTHHYIPLLSPVSVITVHNVWFCYSSITKAEWDIELILDKQSIVIRQIPTPSDIILYPISLLSSNNTSIFVVHVLNCNKINDDSYLVKFWD